MVSPRDYGLPHGAFRPNQRQMIEWVLDLGRGEVLRVTSGGPSREPMAEVGIIEAPTGSGKSVFPAGASSRCTTWVLVRTHLLQHQYQRYGAVPMKGMGNYRCSHPHAGPSDTASECLWAEDGMYQCSQAKRRQCDYLLDKETALASSFVATNYAYWITAPWPREHLQGILVCDECHQLPDQIIDMVGLELTEADRRAWGFERFPSADSAHSILSWLDAAVRQLRLEYARARRDTREGRQRRRAAEHLGKRMKEVATRIEADPLAWFVLSGPRAKTLKASGVEMQVPALIAKPLTARHHFRSLFRGSFTTALMSATIGNPRTFATELGLAAGEYEFAAVPNRWSPGVRPVHVMDMPKIRGDMERHRRVQAELIAGAVLKCPPDWSGVVHVTRVSEAPLLAKQLARYGDLQDRLWVGYDLSRWNERRVQVPGSLAVTWAWYEGVDLTEDRICLTAKIPFAYLGDPFERARLDYSREFYRQRAAWGAEQSLNRTRRGEPEDYDLARREQLVAIADPDFWIIEPYISKSLREALVYG